MALLLDNCASHTKSVPGLKAVTLFFLPPNTTSVLQPLDQGIIKNFKHFYRTSISERQVRCLDSGTPFTITLLDALSESQKAWAKVTPQTISNCWFHMTFRESLSLDVTSDGNNNEEIFHAGLTNEEFRDYITVDNELLTSEVPTDEDILSQVKGTTEEDSDSDSEVPEEPETPKKPATLKEAEAACEMLRSFLMTLPETSDELESLCKIKHLLSKVKRSSVKQSSIAEFFKTF